MSGNLIHWWQAVSESSSNEDFGKPLDEWTASKAAKGELGTVRAWLPRLIAALAVLTLVIVLTSVLAGCAHNPCDGHGGTRVVANGVFFCNDGTVQ